MFVLLAALISNVACSYKQEESRETEVSVELDDLSFKIPCDWTILSTSHFQKNDNEVLYIETAGFDEEALKEAFGYKTTEESIKSLLPNGVYLQSQKAETFNTDGLSTFQYKCTIDKYNTSEEMFVQTDEVVYLDFLIDQQNKIVYIMYFLNEMADQDKISEFFSKVQHEEKVQNTTDMLYRWQIAD